MKDATLQKVKEFLLLKKITGPLLLGFSGGNDSLALLHLLLECRRFFSLDLHVVHIDHGWRKESGKEAKNLQKEVQKLKIPFHLYRLTGGCQGEEKARKDRLQVFSELYRTLSACALFLAHHGDDQSETILKRVLEGSHLFSLGGIREEALLHGMAVWRPLLGVSKEELKEWLKVRGLKSLQDPTAFDLRTRMRQEIFPQLQKQFGKKISSNLYRLGQTAQDLQDYLDRRIEPYFNAIQGQKVDLAPFYPFEKIELKAFLKKWTMLEEIFLSHAALETLYQLIEGGSSRRKIISRGKTIEIHRRAIAIKK